MGGNIAIQRLAVNRLYQILFDQLPFIPLWYENNLILYRKGLQNVAPRPDASYRIFVDVSRGS